MDQRNAVSACTFQLHTLPVARPWTTLSHIPGLLAGGRGGQRTCRPVPSLARLEAGCRGSLPIAQQEKERTAGLNLTRTLHFKSSQGLPSKLAGSRRDGAPAPAAAAAYYGHMHHLLGTTLLLTDAKQDEQAGCCQP